MPQAGYPERCADDNYSGNDSRIVPAQRYVARRLERFSSDSGHHGPAATGRHGCICSFGGDQLLPPAQRSGAVACASDLSAFQKRVRTDVRPDRSDHAGLSRHCFAVTAAGRPLHRSPAAALFADLRHGLHVHRHLRHGVCAELSHAAGRLGAAWSRRIDLSSRSVAAGASRFRWRARLCPIAVSARRQFRQLDRSYTGGVHHPAARTEQPCVVCADRSLRDGYPAGVGQLVSQRRPRQAQDANRCCAGCRAASGAGAPRHRDFDCAGVLEIFLSVEHHKLLHLLPDAPLHAVGADVADLSVRLSCCRCRRHFHWRSDR